MEVHRKSHYRTVTIQFRQSLVLMPPLSRVQDRRIISPSATSHNAVDPRVVK